MGLLEVGHVGDGLVEVGLVEMRMNAGNGIVGHKIVGDGNSRNCRLNKRVVSMTTLFNVIYQLLY